MIDLVQDKREVETNMPAGPVVGLSNKQSFRDLEAILLAVGALHRDKHGCQVQLHISSKCAGSLNLPGLNIARLYRHG